MGNNIGTYAFVIVRLSLKKISLLKIIVIVNIVPLCDAWTFDIQSHHSNCD